MDDSTSETKSSPTTQPPSSLPPSNPTAGANASTWWVAITIAIIGALASVTAAYFQSKKIAEERVDVVLGGNIVPIGTVVASLLSPAEFYRQANIQGAVFDPEKYTWVLADGRDVTRSAFERKLPDRKTHVPDLRGLFLRGMNEGRSDDKRDPEATPRTAGDYQPDALGSHNHSATLPGIAATVDALGFGGLNLKSVGAGPNSATSVTVANTGSAETRPRNSAVYWYVRIN